jgi:hypothetical protein
MWLWGCSPCKISSPGPVLHGTKWQLWRPHKQSPTLHSRCGINKGLIKRGSTIDHWRSRCKGWPTTYTYIRVHMRSLCYLCVSSIFSFSVSFMSYQRKAGNSSHNFLLYYQISLSDLFPSGLLTYASYPLFPLHALPISFFLTWSFQLYLVKSTSYDAPSYAVFSNLLPFLPLLGPNILLSILFSNTLSLCSSLKVRIQVSYSHKNAGKIIVSHITLYRFLTADENTRWWTEG